MDDSILFSPGNRLLGGATGDFALYGGQSDPNISIIHARPDSAQAPEPAGAPAVPAAPEAATPAPGSMGTAPSTPSEVSSGAVSPTAFQITPQDAALHASEPITPFAPDLSVPGAVTPAAIASESAMPALARAEAPPAEPADTVEGFSGTAATLLDDLAGSPDAGSALDPVMALVSPLATTAGDGVSDVLTHAVGGLDDTLDGLSGSDPLGGVATLVSLVSVSDMFDLTPTDAPLVDAAGDPGLGVLDVLAGEETLSADTLLGGTHHEDGLLGDHLIDNPLGL